MFVEKPLAFDLDEIIGLVRLAESSGARLQLGFQRRFDPAYARRSDWSRPARSATSTSSA